MYPSLLLSVLAILVFSATNVRADSDDSYTSYDAIVSELKADAEDKVEPVRDDELNWDEVALSGGMAMTASFLSVNAPNGANGAGMLKGLEVYGGANLFSKKARAEIAFRTFAPEDFGKVNINLRELEARLIFLPYLREKMNLRMGFGLTGRYMDVDGRANGRTEHAESSTAASALILGFEHKLSRAVTFGPDVAYRNSLGESFDKSAWDAAIRLNATF